MKQELETVKSFKEFLATNPDDREFVSWAASATVSQLEESLKMLGAGHHWSDHVRSALQAKLVEVVHRPHWTVIPGFVVALAAMVFAAIAAWPVIREWLPHSASAKQAPSGSLPQSNVAPTISPLTNRTASAPLPTSSHSAP